MATEFEHLDVLTDEEVGRFKDDALESDYKARVLIAERKQFQDRIIAQGDSWFDYKPGTDLIDCLRKNHGYAIDKQDNYSKAGDTLENMIRGASVDMYMKRLRSQFGVIVEKVGKLQSKIFLFSGGGNDIAGDEFIDYLNHHDTGLPAIKMEYANSMVNETFRGLLVYMISELTRASPAIKIIMHGYGKTAPTGIGVLWYGPWLRPALVKKHIEDEEEKRRAVFYMIKLYNDMLLGLSKEHANFNYIDLTRMLDPDKDWANELHLRNSKFADAAKLIHEKIHSLTGGLTRVEE